MTLVDAVENEATDAPTQGRRRALQVGASMLIAGLATLINPRHATAADCLGSPCCTLASCRWCSYQVSRDRYTCPSGYYRTYWTCRTSNGTLYICGECSGAAGNCFQGPFYCSTWYRA